MILYKKNLRNSAELKKEKARLLESMKANGWDPVLMSKRKKETLANTLPDSQNPITSDSESQGPNSGISQGFLNSDIMDIASDFLLRNNRNVSALSLATTAAKVLLPAAGGIGKTLLRSSGKVLVGYAKWKLLTFAITTTVDLIKNTKSKRRLAPKKQAK